MSQLDGADIEKLATLAQIKISPDEQKQISTSLSNIMGMISEMEKINTDGIEPATHSLKVSQRWREDEITEPNQRELFQSLTPHVAAGLYLVPKVIE